MNTLLIFFWNDGTWTSSDEYSEDEFGWKGDDFGILEMPPDATDSDVKREISNRLN